MDQKKQAQTFETVNVESLRVRSNVKAGVMLNAIQPVAYSPVKTPIAKLDFLACW